MGCQPWTDLSCPCTQTRHLHPLPLPSASYPSPSVAATSIDNSLAAPASSSLKVSPDQQPPAILPSSQCATDPYPLDPSNFAFAFPLSCFWGPNSTDSFDPLATSASVTVDSLLKNSPDPSWFSVSLRTWSYGGSLARWLSAGAPHRFSAAFTTHLWSYSGDSVRSL